MRLLRRASLAYVLSVPCLPTDSVTASRPPSRARRASLRG
jgi:hypothetical protein